MAWVFDLTGGEWVQFGAVLEGDAAFDHAGWDVALSEDGNVLAVSIPGSETGQNDDRNSGLVRVYARNGNVWEELGNAIRGEASGDEAGKSVSLTSDGQTIAVGARLNDGRGVNAGHVRVFTLNGNAWTQVGSDIEGERTANEFGWSSMISGNGQRLAVGGYLNADNGFRAGHARVYEFDGSNWIQLGQDIDGPSANSDFGFSVTLSRDGTTLAVGGPRNSNDNGTLAGIVQTFRYVGNDWVQVGQTLLGTSGGDLFGHKVAISSDGATLVVGANNEASDRPGYAAIYELRPPQS
eukprot:CAMPEP_0116546746 /NCGR_PEP_ID=MMETSP0397-20121206/3392_1 /TAXON_ID=216820 /ORGANISM="Cyclophora tenuis, Strain ECT3854" /LENGTH=294 /DNA_ID=CAMNT_0004071199 /DNA_START=123 /DNA_END=1007 /DNA_ORIENTATION=-